MTDLGLRGVNAAIPLPMHDDQSADQEEARGGAEEAQSEGGQERSRGGERHRRDPCQRAPDQRGRQRGDECAGPEHEAHRAAARSELRGELERQDRLDEGDERGSQGGQEGDAEDVGAAP